MAFYKQDIVDINLNTGNIHRSFLSHAIGYKNDDADRFGIRTFRDGVPQDLTGASCQAVFMAPNGSKIALTSYGTVSGNVAYVTLPPACYDYEGQFCLAIQLVGGGVTGTMRIVDGMVINTGASGTVAPTSAVPTYQEIIAQYDSMVAATAAANGAIAATYSGSATYKVGDYCIHDGGLYRCTTAITTAEAWNAAHWTATKIGPDVSDLKSAIDIIPVSVLENVGITTVSPLYGKLTSNTGYNTSVFEIDGYSEVIVKRPASTNVYFLVSDTLYTASDVPTGDIASVNQSGKSYTYTNPNHRKYLYIMTKSTTASYSASVSINIPNELTKDAEKLSDLKAETTVLNTLKSLYDNHGTTFFPVAYINNAEVVNNGGYGKISSVTGSKVAIYKLSKDLSYYIKRYNANGGMFLVSNILYEQPINAYITKITMSGQDAEYTFTNTNDYEYLYITAVLASNANYYSVITLDATNIVNKIYNDAYMIPEFPQNIVCTYKHMYVANVNGVLKFSNDKLKTFSKTLDVSSYGLIKTYHLFENGCIAFFTHNKAYYSEDWTTVHEASVYESNGTTPYAMSTYDNFTNTKEDSNRKFVNGQDLFVFGNYGITDEENTRRVIWGSFDNGHSYKVLYEFNISGAYTIRHVHTVIYNPNFDKYICACGDSQNEARVLQFEISGSSMTNLTELGSGITHYMWAAVAFYGEDVYYCLENSPSAVVRVKFTEIDDPTKHHNILENLPNYPIGVFIGDHGDMLVTLTRYRASDSYSPIADKYDARKVYYSEDREHFHEIIVPDIPTRAEDVYIYYGFYSQNADGKVLSGIFDNTTGGLDTWTKMPSVALDDIVKKAGFPNAFKAIDPNREIIPVLSMVCGGEYTVVEDQKIDIPSATFYPWNASVKEYDIYEYDDSRIRITDDGTKILGYQPGQTTVKIRAKSNWNVTAEFTVTVTPAT